MLLTVKLLAVVSTDTYVSLSLDELPKRHKAVVLYVLAPSGHGKDYIIDKYCLSDKALNQLDFSTLKPGRWFDVEHALSMIVNIRSAKIHPPEELVPPVRLYDLFEVDRVDEDMEGM